MSLLGRLRRLEERHVDAASAERAERASILAHLQAMCGTRLGAMRVRPDYGLPPITEMVHSFPDAAGALARALAQTIEKYEPRLADVRVRHVPTQALDLVVTFEVTAVLRSSEQRTPLRFATTIDASRRVHVA